MMRQPAFSVIHFMLTWFLLLLFSTLSAYSANVFLNPGIKVATNLGKPSTLILGFEMSVGEYTPNRPIVGGVFGYQYDIVKRKALSYFEGEIGTLYSGFAVGMENNGFKSAPRARFFAGYGAYFSLKYSSLTPMELGLVGKFPLRRFDLNP